MNLSGKVHGCFPADGRLVTIVVYQRMVDDDGILNVCSTRNDNDTIDTIVAHNSFSIHYTQSEFVLLIWVCSSASMCLLVG